MAPGDRAPQRSLPLGQVARAAGQQRQPPVEALQDLRRRERAHARGRELERERELVEPPADLEHMLVRLEVGSHLPRTAEEEADALLLHERRNRVLALGREPQQLAARDDHPQVGARGGQPAKFWGRAEHLLEVVQYEQHPPVADMRGEVAVRADRRADRRQHDLRVTDGLQADPPDAVLVVVHCFRGCLDSEPRLPGAARPGQREQANLRVSEQLQDLAELLLAPDERCRLLRQIRLVERLQRRKVGVAELPDPLGRGQVLEPVIAEVVQAVGAGELTRRLRDEHLASVPDRRDPSRAVDVEPGVALLGHDRLAGVDAHPHPDRTLGERLLPFACGRERVARPPEGDEEGVALRVDLDPAVRLESRPQRAAVLGQRIRVGIAQLVQQLGRPLDVGEEKGDGA